MLFEVKCSSCGKDQIVLDISLSNEPLLVCKNPDCENFNNALPLSYVDWSSLIIKGYSGEQTVEDDDGCKWHETYENGRIVEQKKIEE